MAIKFSRVQSEEQAGDTGDHTDNPTYIFTEPRVGFRMPKGDTAGGDEPAGPVD